MEERTNPTATKAHPTASDKKTPQHEAPRPLAGMLTAEQAAEFLGVKKSYLYKLTYLHAIPYYKPFGRKIYFDRTELEGIIRRNRVATDEEIGMEASRYLMKHGRI